MSTVTLLFLCGGRRVHLLRRFRQAIDACGGGRLLTTDTEPFAATRFVADRSVRVAPCHDIERFAADVAEICAVERVTAILPLTCSAVAAVPALRHRVPAQIISGDDAAIGICVDKLATARHFQRVGLTTPEIIEHPTAAALPLFHRLRCSEGSRGAFVVRDVQQLAAITGGEGLLTRYVHGTEFTVDCYKDLHGQLISVVPRERLRVRAGEVEQSAVRQLPELIEQTQVALTPLHFIGPASVQAIIAGGTIYFTEINLRYGGGVTLSIAAGAESPRWLVAELAGTVMPQMGAIRWNLGMSRYDDEFYFDAG